MANTDPFMEFLLQELMESVEKNETLPKELNAEIFEKICFGDGVSEETHSKFISLVQQKLDESITKQTKLLQNELVYGYSCWYLLFNDETLLAEFTTKIYNTLQSLLLLKPYGKFKSDHNLKEFAKMCLSFYIDDKTVFDKLKDLAKNILNELSLPLQKEWQNICESKDDILDIKFDADSDKNVHEYAKQLLDKNAPDVIQKQLWNIDLGAWWPKIQWLQPGDEKIEILDKQINTLLSNSNKFIDDEKKDKNEIDLSRIMDDKNRYDKYNIISLMIQENALILNEPFQKLMKDVFYSNSKDMNIECEDNDYGYKSAPVKTRARVRIKCFNDYRKEYGEPNNYCMVWDWIRCALICSNTKEMIGLYNLIVNSNDNKYFVKKIIRVKNGFYRNSESNYGYRAILINFVFGNMVAEIQLILLSYLKIRKQMHLYYKIVRSDDGDDLARDFSKWNDK
eukprot:38072_1